MVSVSKNQQFLSEATRTKLLSTLSPLDPEITIDQINDMPKNHKEHLRALMRLRAKYPNNVFPSLDSLAEYTGRCRRAVQNYNALFKELGFISWRRGYIGRANNYVFNPIFDNLHVRRGLRFVVRSFFFLPLSILFGVNAQNAGNAHQIYVFSSRANYKENRNTKVLTTTTRGLRLEADPSSKVVSEKRRDMEIKRPPSLKSLNFSRAGEIKLAIFPQEARDAALTQLRGWSKPLVVSKVFGLYWSFCKQYCETNKIHYDTKESLRNLKAEGVPFEADGLDAENPYTLSESQKGESGSHDKAAPPGTFVRPKTGPYAEAQVPASRREIPPERDVAAKLEMTKNLLEDNEYAEWTQYLLDIKDLAAFRKI